MPSAEPVVSQAGGVLRRQDLLGAGVTRKGLARALSEGALRQLGTRVIALAGPVEELELRAAVTALDAVVSHQDAARLWGVELVEAGRTPHVTVARNRSRSRHAGTSVHRSTLRPDEVDVDPESGLRVTSVVRTLLDLSRNLPLEQAVVAADSALRQGLCSLPELIAGHAARPRGAGRPRITRVLDLVDPASGSVLESLFRVLVVLAGLPLPQSQFHVLGGGRVIGRVDFAWPHAHLIVETDGFAFHADRERYRADRRRINALVLAGWRVLRFSWEDVVHHPERVVAEVQAALVAVQ